MKSENLDPSHFLYEQLKSQQPDFAFNAKSLDAALKWQQKTRKALIETLGFGELLSFEPAIISSNKYSSDVYEIEKLYLQTSKNSTMPVYILKPTKSKISNKAIIALHGHGGGVKEIIGLNKEHNAPIYQKEFALQLCKKGFTVIAPEIACFGEREINFQQGQKESYGKDICPSCVKASVLSLHLGKSILGFRVAEIRQLIKYLISQKGFYSNLAIAGISGGGMLALFTAAIDINISACAVSGYLSTFYDSILSLHHCNCNYVPGLAKFGEMADLASLIAPRPFLIQSGRKDAYFPHDAVLKAQEQLSRIYQLFNAENDLHADYFDGEHTINLPPLLNFLKDNNI
jgi:dienelactone hydrolase